MCAGKWVISGRWMDGLQTELLNYALKRDPSQRSVYAKKKNRLSIPNTGDES
jgi:hypothetical protein